MSVRRKGPEDHPKLPLSLFTATSAGASFGLPPSHGNLHPAKIIDANITTNDVSYTLWKKDAAGTLADNTVGVVISLPDTVDRDIALINLKSATDSKVISLIIPFDLENPDSTLESILSSTTVPVSFSTVFTSNTTRAVDGLRWALKTGRPVDINVQATLSDSLEGFVDLIGKATVDLEYIPPIVLSNILPPPILLTPTHLDFQSEIATLSLISQLYVKFLPPVWDAPTEASDTQQQKEWKRRIMMYLAPVIEAFGSERIIYGSSSRTPSNPANWYKIARESLVETGIEQALIDNVFYANADRVYGKRSDKS